MSAPRDPPPQNGTTVSHHEAVPETFTPQPQSVTETQPNDENQSNKFAFGLVGPQPQNDPDQPIPQLPSNSNGLVNVGQPYVLLNPLDEIIETQKQISTPENSQPSIGEPNVSPIVSLLIIIRLYYRL